MYADYFDIVVLGSNVYKYEDSICGLSFISMIVSFIVSCKQRTVQSDKLDWQCPVCSLWYNTNHNTENRERHLRMHNGNLTLSCPEPRCGEMFSDRGGRRDHYRSIHTTKKKHHECIFCSAQYSYQHDYDRHLVVAQHPFADQTDIDKAVHAQAVISVIADIHRPRRYVCKEPRCGMSFPDSSNCRGHYDTAHTVLKKVYERNFNIHCRGMFLYFDTTIYI